MAKRPTELFPEIEPYNSGVIYSDDDQPIYFEECGNPKGKPILRFHGGPGAGSDAKDRRWLDPEKWRQILFDQRDCGRSKPPKNLQKNQLGWEPLKDFRNNTTQNLISDARKVLRELGIEKTAVTGHSWGSTLGGVFAITHPEMLSGMLLSGIFLGEKEEIDYLFGGQVSWHFPEVWENFSRNVLKPHGDAISYFAHELSSASSYRKRHFAEIWVRFEASLMNFENKPEKQEETKDLIEFLETLAQLETHYFRNNCFLEDGYILNNAGLIPHVPIILVQGRYDFLCPPKSAWRLYKALPQSELFMVRAGHSTSDSEMLKTLVAQLDTLYDTI